MSFFEFGEFSETSASSARSSSRPATRSTPPSRTTPSQSGTTTRPASGGRSASTSRSSAAGKTAPGTRTGGAGSPRPSTPSSPTSAQASGAGFSFDRVAPLLQRGWDFVAPQVSPSIAPQRGAEPAATADPGHAAPYWQPPPSTDRLALLMQALQQRQVPPLPVPGMSATPSSTPQADGLGLLTLILSNPQFQHVLQQAASTGAGPAPAVPLPMPALQPPARMRTVDIPLGAVINAIAGLTGPALMQLNARTSEADPEVPEYLVSEDGEFVVDPASSDDRAALVVHMFEVSDEAQRLEALRERQSRPHCGCTELDDTDEWARDAGLL